jgi:PAS domain S-box-containing protein
MKNIFYHSLLWRLIIPVIVIGTFCSILLNYFLVPPIVSILEKRIDKTIIHAATLAVNICEERLTDLLDLRMENNAEMNSTSKKKAIGEVKKIAYFFSNIRIVIVDDNGKIQGASFFYPDGREAELLVSLSGVEEMGEKLSSMELWDDKVLFHVEYFPFWRWHIISFIPEDEYFAPIISAKRIIQLGTFGTLITVVASVVFLFLLSINRPLKKIINAADAIRKGNFRKIGLLGDSEIEQVAVAFDHMVDKLESDKERIDHMLLELRDSEEQYRVLSESSLALVIMLRNDAFLYANKKAAAFFRKTPEHLIGGIIYSFFKEHKEQIFRKKMKKLSSGESSVEHFEAPFEIGDKEEISWLEILASVVPFHGKQSILIHAVDKTKKRQMEIEQHNLRQKVTRGERMETLAMLAGGVAHDLNNILSGIVSYPELLLLDLSKEDRFYRPLKTIHKSGLKAAAIVQDLLTLTRRGVVVTAVVNLHDIIEEYLASPEFDNLHSFYPAIKIATDISPDLMNIQGSQLHLSKSLMNLVTNAAEAMPQGGTIEVKAENRYIDVPIEGYENIVEGEYVVLTVADTGQGISEEDIGKIFEPFYTKKIMGRSGTGLGMSVVWGAVKDHNGYIEVASREGEGTTFTLYFPASRKSISEQIADLDIDEVMGECEKILVVDDVPEQRIIAASMLEKLNYCVTSVASGEEAVAAVQQSVFDLLLIDMIMEPGMDGLDTYRATLKVRPSQKAIIASGFSETNRIRQMMALGAGAYIKKPYSMRLLAITVKKHLKSET